jgi:hypothetical protein
MSKIFRKSSFWQMLLTSYQLALISILTGHISFFFNAFSSESTFSACPAALTLSHTLIIFPSGFIRNVVLTVPVISLPLKRFGCRTSYAL